MSQGLLLSVLQCLVDWSPLRDLRVVLRGYVALDSGAQVCVCWFLVAVCVWFMVGSAVCIEVQHGSLTVRSVVCVLAFSCFIRGADRALDVLRCFVWSSPKAGAEGLPFGIVRALDPCTCRCMHECQGRTALS